MRPTETFILISLVAFALLPWISAVPNLEEYRPEELVEGEEFMGGINIFKSVISLTVVLIILKKLKIKLSFFIDASTFFSGYILGSMFGIGLPLGLLLLSLRKSKNLLLFNLSSSGTIICFALLFSAFITPEAGMLLLALLSFYDVIGVLYFPYIKFLWLETTKTTQKKSKIIKKKSEEPTKQKERKYNFESMAILFKNGMVGAGDYALPLMFSLSFGFKGLLSLPLLALGFSFNQKLARVFGAFPGIPFQALFAYGFYILVA